MLIELGKKIDEHSENFDKKLENIEKNLQELKNTITEMKSSRRKEIKIKPEINEIQYT